MNRRHHSISPSPLQTLVRHILNGGSASDEGIHRPAAVLGTLLAQGSVNSDGSRRARSCNQIGVTTRVDAQKKATAAAEPEYESTANHQETKKKGFDAWIKISNSGIEPRWRSWEKFAEGRFGTRHIWLVCNMEHLRESSRSKRDKERKRKGQWKEERKASVTGDERVRLVVQMLEWDVGWAPALLLPGR
ncbi:hypothetical protein B0J12DRAFT_733507 [Macrophomina phaseolina]|uniref:Uncharacterized protein n=1 Tax=Macrophomina phaseolina TaxID=35725 RepID=A0ABQ8FRU8_9PEZI|nr:hypothetical protein B0J12DRAFT_733507 [Macrophomina phaseolina]